MIPGVLPGVRSRALRAFTDEMKNAPLLANSRVIKTFRAFDDNPALSAPTTDMMPFLQARMVGGPVRRIASTRRQNAAPSWAIESSPGVVIELYTRGSNAADAADLADLIHSVYAPADDIARKQLQGRMGAVGIRDWRLEQEILPPSLDAYTQAYCYSVGSYRLTLIIQN